MAHNHSHNHLENKSASNIKTAFFLNIFFTVLEIFGGIWTNSTAILSDALHDLGTAFRSDLPGFFKINQHKKAMKNLLSAIEDFHCWVRLLTGLCWLPVPF